METKSTVDKVLHEHINREWQDKLGELFTFFCNNVYIGQWELAKTAIPTLLKELDKGRCNTDFIDILISISGYPYSQSLGSSTVPSPHHLSWLCLQELKQLYPDPHSEKKPLIDRLTKDVDFRLTLSQLIEADDVIKELYIYFKRYILKVKIPAVENEFESGDFLSSTTLNSLRITMLDHPSLGHSLIKALITEEENTDSRNNEMLQAVYLDCINIWIDRLQERRQQNSSKASIDECVDKALQILALYSPVPYWNYLQLRQLFTRLLTLALGGDISSLTAERVASVICGRDTPYLLDEFCKIFQEVSQLTRAQSRPDQNDGLTDDHRLCLSMMTQMNRDVSWRDFFLTCHKRRVHFLAQILDLSLALVRAGQFIELQDLLSYLELQPLKPAVLLMGWSHCVTSAHARTLLDTLWDDSAECPNNQLVSSCRKLAYHLDLIQWCLDRAKPLLENTTSSPGRQATELLQGLESHSVLYMLHKSTSLASLDHSEVLQLLTSVSTDKRKDGKKKTVTFQDEAKSTETSPEPVFNIEQQKDIAIFRGFCALKNVMDAVVFCADNFEHKLMNPVQVKRSVRPRKLYKNFLTDPPVSSSEGEDSSSPDGKAEQSKDDEEASISKENSQQFVSSYENTVVQKLKETKEHLSNIQPLTYRLEVLENIFSLLFVTHEDLCDTTGAVEPETDEDNEDSKRSSREFSHDSLNTSAMSEDESVADDFVVIKSSAGKIPSKVTPSPAASSLHQTTSTGSLDYDTPFVDPYSKQKESSPTLEETQSAYFTLTSEHQQKKKQDIAVETTQPVQQIPKKPKRRRKRTTSEPSPNTMVGFLCNEYLVRDILLMLKDAISDFNTAKYTLAGKASEIKDTGRTSKPSKANTSKIDPALETALQGNIVTSVQSDSLSKRLTKLTQIVHEAWWRFQLVAHEAFPRQPGRVLTERVYITDNDINILPVCEGKVYSPETDYYKAHADAETRSSSLMRSSSNSHSVLPQSNIMAKMMASPESLLVHSLVKNNPSQAAEVMKLFRLMEKTAETCEVSFADMYRTSSGRIWDLEPEDRQPAQSQQRVGKRSVKALSKAAAVGVATATLSNVVEDLLAKPCVPPVPRPKSSVARENFSHLFNLDPSSALLLDLLCTSCRTWDTCSNMLDIIKTKTKLLENDPRHSVQATFSSSSQSDSSMSARFRQMSQSPESSSSSVTSPTSSMPRLPTKDLKPALQGVVGCGELLWSLYDLIHAWDSEATVSLPSHHHPPASAKVGLQHHLHSAYSSLKADNLRSMEITTAELRKAVDRVLRVLSGTSQGSMDISIEDPAPSPSPSPRGSLSGSMSGSGASHTGSTTSLKRAPVKQPSDQNPLHIAVKHLMYIMEKYVPGEGLTKLLLGKSSKVSGPPIKNFLLSLYEHVKEMSYLVADCEGRNRELTSNYFKVLNDGPVSVLGRLLFVKKMPPAKLEAVAEKLSLNLTHTIVHSCCPKIPSKHPPALPECGEGFSVQMCGTRLYNGEECQGKVSRTASKDDDASPQTSQQTEKTSPHPETTVRAILTDLMKLMEDVSTPQNAKGVFDLACAKKLVQMSEYEEIIKRVQQLRNVDMAMLESEEECLCFYGNLTNLMVIHCHMAHIQTRQKIHSILDSAKATSADDEVELCPLAAAEYMAYFSGFSYSVGQLGLVSAFDLLTTLCRQGLEPPTHWKQILACCKLDLSAEDPWKMFAPPTEPNLLFVLSLGCVSSPPVQVLKPDQVRSQLEKARKDYLHHCMLISVDKERILLPELLLWHEKDFVTDKVSRKEALHTPLIRWAAQYLSAERQKQLQQLFSLDSFHGENIDATGRNELPFHVDIDRFDNLFSITFDMVSVKVGQLNPPAIAKVPRKPTPSHYLSSSLDRSGQGWSLELPSYNLTPVTLEYVKQDSLLVATMVSLVCSDNLDNIEQHFTDDHFNMPESNSKTSNVGGLYPDSLLRPHRSTSDISLVNIRSYRYHRLTDDYPILQRHLLHYILPLAGADNPDLLNSGEPILKFVTNEIDDQVKLCMFSLPSSEQFQWVVQDMAIRLVEEHKWLETLNILHSLPETVVEQHLHLQALHDFVLTCWSITQVKKPGFAPKVGDGLRKFYSPHLQARTVLTISHALPLDLSIDLLDLCMATLDKNSGLHKAVSDKYEEMWLYSKIMDCVKSLRIKLSMTNPLVLSMNVEDQQLHRILEDLSDWQQIPVTTKEQPEDVLLVLEKAGDFVTAKSWAEIHKLSEDFMRDIQERHLYYLLTQEQPETVTAFQLLDELRVTSETQCLSVCQALAKRLSNPSEIKFVMTFMLQYLTQHLMAEDVEDLRLRRIGAKALMCIPVKLRSEYSHLISCPHLILEQLLMNMKAELAGQIFEQIKTDFIAIKEPKLRLAQDQFNNLLTTYANKAIEVTVVQVLVDTSRSESANSASSSGHPDHSGGGANGDQSSSVARRQSFDRRKNELSVSPTSSNDTATKGPNKLVPEGGGRFIMPSQPPPQDQWVPDDATSVCMVCKVERFSMFNRRHHCRRCGRVVCSACSTKQSVIFGVLARTCDECFEQMNANRGQEEHEIYSQRMKERLSGVSASPGSGYLTGPASPSVPNILGPERLKRSMANAILQVNQCWKLRPDAAFCEQTRSEFYYEQAPNVSLCISILKQHSCRDEAGKLILTICDKLSSHLVPISPGVPNPEIDYNLIISVMKQLLFQAKFDFLHTNDTGMTELCDMYLGRVDLLGVMVEANYQDLPTIKELTKQDSVRALRDKLIADERLSLAMEVSTKCGIDPAGVWSAMGFACLHLGDFQGAREKFARCLKVPTDKNQSSASQSRLLGDILDFLDTIPSTGLTEVQRLLRNPASICDIKTLLVPSVGEENRIESVPYQECLFYLRTYGSYMDHISFLRKHSYWMKAVQFAVDRHCSADVFVNGLMVPAMNSGEMGRLLEQMLMLDPTLDKWTSYLTATCKHLLKQKYFYTLYQVQLFMKDFIRAAMTCISHFYQRGAKSYLDLSGRLQFLFTAQQHLQAYLDPGQWGSVPHPLAPHTPSPSTSPRQNPSWEKPNPESAARMTLSPEEVKKHIRTIALQIEVTKFLEECMTQAMGGGVYPTSQFVTKPSAQICTLFGQGSARTELVNMILLSGSDFGAGFDLALRVIKECRLNSTAIFTHCSRELAKQGMFAEIKSLTEALIEAGLVDDDGIDEIVGASLLVIADSHSQGKDESDSLIQLLRNDNNKINAFILCGKLRSAYLLAVKRDRVEDVQRIAGAAQRLGQSAVRNICKKWLEQHQK